MSFSDHKITAFTHKIADLPDQPNLPADELKERFDSSPEELRVAHNAICDDAARLEARVEGIVVDTFGDTIDKEMLSDELAAELDAKAVESSVASRITAEQTARESADSSLGSRMATAESTISTHTTQIAQKCQAYVGSYTGDGKASQKIALGFTPKAVFAVMEGMAFQRDLFYSAALAVTNQPAKVSGSTGLAIESGGFRAYEVSQNFMLQMNSNNVRYLYIALQ